MMQSLLFCVLLLSLSQSTAGMKMKETDPSPLERRQLCHWPCKCDAQVQCAPGISSVLDGCGCCKSCARQIGEICNERDVCDPHKSMYCDFSKDHPWYKVGICAYMMGVGCDLNGAHYDNGQAFEPSPLYKCTCISGAIGCTLAFVQKPEAMLSNKPIGLMSNRNSKHQQDTIYRTVSAYRETPLLWKKNCLVQTSPWTPCSTTCGFGISVRVNNDHYNCEMRKEQRLCLLRPCDKRVLNKIKVPKGKTCRPKFQVMKPEKFSLSGCTSIQKYRPSYCGICKDNRSCIPNKSKMVKIEFHCKGKSTKVWKMQWITSCVCLKNLNHADNMFSDLQLM